TTPSWFVSASANAARGSYFLAASSADAGEKAVSAAAMITVPVRRMSVSSALDLPGAVRLPAGGPVGLVLLAADHDRLAVLLAVLAVGELGEASAARGADHGAEDRLRVVLDRVGHGGARGQHQRKDHQRRECRDGTTSHRSLPGARRRCSMQAVLLQVSRHLGSSV